MRGEYNLSKLSIYVIMETIKIVLFKGNKIRKIIYNNEWWFSVIDVISALTGSSIPRRYWSDLKIKLKQEGFHEVYEKNVQLKLEARDGKCVRLIM